MNETLLSIRTLPTHIVQKNYLGLEEKVLFLPMHFLASNFVIL